MRLISNKTPFPIENSEFSSDEHSLAFFTLIETIEEMKYAVRWTEKSERWSIWKRREICFLVIRESDDITNRRYGRSSYEAFCATRSYVGTFALHNLLAAFRSPCIRIRDGYDSPRHSFTCF